MYLSDNARKFAISAYDSNSIKELEEGLKLKAADKTDCKIWNIKPSEWRNAIKIALKARLDEDSEEFDFLTHD